MCMWSPISHYTDYHQVDLSKNLRHTSLVLTYFPLDYLGMLSLNLFCILVYPYKCKPRGMEVI